MNTFVLTAFAGFLGISPLQAQERYPIFQSEEYYNLIVTYVELTTRICSKDNISKEQCTKTIEDEIGAIKSLVDWLCPYPQEVKRWKWKTAVVEIVPSPQQYAHCMHDRMANRIADVVRKKAKILGVVLLEQ